MKVKHPTGEVLVMMIRSVIPVVKAVILRHPPLHCVCAAGAFLMTSADQQHGC